MIVVEVCSYEFWWVFTAGSKIDEQIYKIESLMAFSIIHLFLMSNA